MTKGERLVLIICAVFMVVIIFLSMWVDEVTDEEYNNGIHANCGGRWHLVAQDRLSYTYECDKCYETFTTLNRKR